MVPLPAGCEEVYHAGLWCALAACFCWTSGGIFGSCLGNMQMIPSIRHQNHSGCQKRFLFLCVIFLMLFFCPCSFHNLGKIQQLGAHNTCFNMEEEVYISEWLDRYCVRTLCIVLAFSVSAEHPHYFIKLYTFFWFAKTHGKEEEILRSLWDFKVIWEE